MDKNEVIEKIKKLLRLSQDKGATEAEAAQAMKFATSLMTKYGIENVSTDEAADPIEREMLWEGQKHRFQYYMGCYTAAAELSAVKIYYSMYSDNVSIWAIGRPERRKATKLMAEYLIAQLEHWYKKMLTPGLSVSARAEYRRTFKFACAQRLRARASQIVYEMKHKDDEAYMGSKALVVMNYFQKESKDIETWMEGVGFQLRSAKSRGRAAGTGTRDGQHAGNTINLQRPLS